MTINEKLRQEKYKDIFSYILWEEFDKTFRKPVFEVNKKYSKEEIDKKLREILVYEKIIPRKVKKKFIGKNETYKLIEELRNFMIKENVFSIAANEYRVNKFQYPYSLGKSFEADYIDLKKLIPYSSKLKPEQAEEIKNEIYIFKSFVDEEEGNIREINEKMKLLEKISPDGFIEKLDGIKEEIRENEKTLSPYLEISKHITCLRGNDIIRALANGNYEIDNEARKDIFEISESNIKEKASKLLEKILPLKEKNDKIRKEIDFCILDFKKSYAAEKILKAKEKKLKEKEEELRKMALLLSDMETKKKAELEEEGKKIKCIYEQRLSRVKNENEILKKRQTKKEKENAGLWKELSEQPKYPEDYEQTKQSQKRYKEILDKKIDDECKVKIGMNMKSGDYEKFYNQLLYAEVGSEEYKEAVDALKEIEINIYKRIEEAKAEKEKIDE